MAAVTLDLRDLPPAKRHPKVMDEFDDLESGETLHLINDHDPRPLYYQLDAEVDAFDADGYTVEKRGPNEFHATIPKI
ncbi:MAG: DUF2249 domain-containing protein [Halodesulfurarchaeum sp.]